MRKFKKLIVGMCTAACCLSAAALPVSAESKDYYSKSGSYEYVLPSYTQPAPYDDFVYFSDDLEEDKRQSEVLNEQCRVTKDNLNCWYQDTAIKEIAEKAINNKKNVYNLRYLTEFGQYILIKDASNIFNYGIVIFDKNATPYGSNDHKVICKCSENDYRELFYYLNSREMDENEYEFTCTNDTDTGYSIFSYNPISNILTAEEYFY